MLSTIDMFKLQLMLRAEAHGLHTTEARRCQLCTTLDDALIDWWAAHEADDKATEIINGANPNDEPAGLSSLTPNT